MFFHFIPIIKVASYFKSAGDFLKTPIDNTGILPI